MDALRDLYLDHAGSIFLGAFVIVTVFLAVAGWRRLTGGWWIGASIAAAVMVGLTTMIALALRGLAPDGAVPPEGWFAVAFAGLLGFVAAADVQLAWDCFARTDQGAWPSACRRCWARSSSPAATCS